MVVSAHTIGRVSSASTVGRVVGVHSRCGRMCTTDGEDIGERTVVEFGSVCTIGGFGSTSTVRGVGGAQSQHVQWCAHIWWVWG